MVMHWWKLLATSSDWGWWDIESLKWESREPKGLVMIVSILLTKQQFLDIRYTSNLEKIVNDNLVINPLGFEPHEIPEQSTKWMTNELIDMLFDNGRNAVVLYTLQDSPNEQIEKAYIQSWRVNIMKEQIEEWLWVVMSCKLVY